MLKSWLFVIGGWSRCTCEQSPSLYCEFRLKMAAVSIESGTEKLELSQCTPFHSSFAPFWLHFESLIDSLIILVVVNNHSRTRCRGAFALNMMNFVLWTSHSNWWTLYFKNQGEAPSDHTTNVLMGQVSFHNENQESSTENDLCFSLKQMSFLCASCTSSAPPCTPRYAHKHSPFWSILVHFGLFWSILVLFHVWIWFILGSFWSLMRDRFVDFQVAAVAAAATQAQVQKLVGDLLHLYVSILMNLYQQWAIESISTLFLLYFYSFSTLFLLLDFRSVAMLRYFDSIVAPFYPTFAPFHSSFTPILLQIFQSILINFSFRSVIWAKMSVILQEIHANLRNGSINGSMNGSIIGLIL